MQQLKKLCYEQRGRILNNKIYLGVMEKNKTSSLFYADERKHPSELNARIYISNSVPPLH